MQEADTVTHLGEDKVIKRINDRYNGNIIEILKLFLTNYN